MNEMDRQQRLWVAQQAEKLRLGKINRREFIRRSALAGFGLTSMRYLSGCAPSAATSQQAIQASSSANSARAATTDTQRFLRDVGGMFKGSKLKIVSEATPASAVISQIMQEEFIPLTGIEVAWEQAPLDQVLAELSQDTVGQLGVNDIYYLDQAWLGRFAHDMVEAQELFEKSDLAYPDWNFADFLPQLVEKISTYQGKLVAIPFDIPIAIMMYRKDIFKQLHLRVPTTIKEYLNTVRTIHEAGLSGVDGSSPLYGTTGEWKAGHYALESDFNVWLWAHGGSIFAADGSPTCNDEPAVAATEYMLELGKYMPATVNQWDWSGQAESFMQGNVGMYISWGEFFPAFDDPTKSRIVGLAQAAPAPQGIALRTSNECGFDETPGISHQAGSSLAISKYSKNIDAAWVFLQWATSSDISARASSLGGGTTPTRKSTFSDERILSKNRVTPGTTRHFDVQLDAIEKRMGSEPHLPTWSSLSIDSFAVELGRLIHGQQGIQMTLDNMAASATLAVERNKAYGWV